LVVYEATATTAISRTAALTTRRNSSEPPPRKRLSYPRFSAIVSTHATGKAALTRRYGFSSDGTRSKTTRPPKRSR
jgi:hypothetical protein